MNFYHCTVLKQIYKFYRVQKSRSVIVNALVVWLNASGNMYDAFFSFSGTVKDNIRNKSGVGMDLVKRKWQNKMKS